MGTQIAFDRCLRIFSIMRRAIHPWVGHINVRADRVGSDVAIEMSDDGEGIEPELLPNISRCFFNGPAPLIARKADSALDWRWSRAWLRCMAAESPPESEGAGHGSRFTVRRPLSVSPAQLDGKLRAPSEIPSRDCLRILVAK